MTLPRFRKLKSNFWHPSFRIPVVACKRGTALFVQLFKLAAVAAQARDTAHAYLRGGVDAWRSTSHMARPLSNCGRPLTIDRAPSRCWRVNLLMCFSGASREHARTCLRIATKKIPRLNLRPRRWLSLPRRSRAANASGKIAPACSSWVVGKRDFFSLSPKFEKEMADMEVRGRVYMLQILLPMTRRGS